MQRNKDLGEKQEYWFMRLREKFFGDREMVDIESLDEGFFGVNFPYLVEVLYMKLMCYSIRDEGKILFIVEREGAKDLADSIIAKKFFPESKKTQVRQGLAILEEMGLIWVQLTVNETRVYIPEVDNMTGKSSKRADEQRRIDRSRKLKELDDGRQQYCRSYGAAQNVYLTKEEYTDISDRAHASSKDFSRVIENVSIRKIAEGALSTNDYEACLVELGEKQTAIAEI